MEKIDLYQRRSFGDLLTDTFVFIKQEFKSFLICFCYLALPVLGIDVLIKSTFLRDLIFYSEGKSAADIFNFNGNILWSYFFNLVVVYWIMLTTLSYIRVYQEKCETGDKNRISVREVWIVMRRKGLSLGIWGIGYVCISLVATLFLIIPGIYFFITLTFGGYLIVMADRKIKEGFSLSFIGGEWWSTFGYGIILNLIISLLSYIFLIPTWVLYIPSLVTGNPENNYIAPAFLLLASLGQNFLYTIYFIGISLKFFSIREGREHHSLYKKINSIGENAI